MTDKKLEDADLRVTKAMQALSNGRMIKCTCGAATGIYITPEMAMPAMDVDVVAQVHRKIPCRHCPMVTDIIVKFITVPAGTLPDDYKCQVIYA